MFFPASLYPRCQVEEYREEAPLSVFTSTYLSIPCNLHTPNDQSANKSPSRCFVSTFVNAQSPCYISSTSESIQTPLFSTDQRIAPRLASGRPSPTNLAKSPRKERPMSAFIGTSELPNLGSRDWVKIDEPLPLSSHLSTKPCSMTNPGVLFGALALTL